MNKKIGLLLFIVLLFVSGCVSPRDFTYQEQEEFQRELDREREKELTKPRIPNPKTEGIR